MTHSQEHTLVGFHAVTSALKTAPADVKWLRIDEKSHNKRLREIESRASGAGIRVIRTSSSELDRLSGQQRHQGVVAGFSGGNIVPEAQLGAVLEAIDGVPLVLVLDGVQDPHNLGACLRTAEAAGVHLVVICKDRSAGITPVVRRAASGAAETLPIVQATNLARVLRELKQRGVWLAGTSDAATEGLYATDLTGPLALVMGSEGKGIRRLTGDLCDYLVNIPMTGKVESLNVSVATGVCLYEINRQRQQQT
jgi:23S rRNA (guanosine2251-2'-O)-methyltransferase